MQGSSQTPNQRYEPKNTQVEVPFRNPEAAAQNMGRIKERVPANVARVLPTLLAESPDPDSALNMFERLSATAGPELFRLFDRHGYLLHYTLIVFGYSQFLGETLIQNTDLFHALAREKSLDLSHSKEELRESFARLQSRTLDTDISLLLARFKKREYVRIMLRDVLDIATLAETTAEISALAEVLIEQALRDTDSKLRKRYGAPQHIDSSGRVVDTSFAVLSLGKLGGNELNYSSDIDLLFIYGDGEEIPSAQISNREYFIRLAQQLTGTLSRVTREGATFRIDLRLRPQGGEGEPAVCLSHALDYYANRAHDWELQALIKLRHSAGDQTLARQFIRNVQPYVYTEELNFSAIETALHSREKIRSRRPHTVVQKAEAIDVKLDRGGIRDIEFLVQCLQRVYGGKEPWLRSGGTLFSLQKLHDKGHISGKEFHELTTTYEFLRIIEHRLQLRTGQQTHRLPRSSRELSILARSVSRDEAEQYSADAMFDYVRERMSAIAEIYNRIVHHQQLQQQQRLETGSEFHLQPFTGSSGNQPPQRQIVERLAADSPAIQDLVESTGLEPQARRNLYRFLTAASTSSERYVTVLRSPQAVKRALPLFAYSEYLTDILVRHPEEIATLEGIRRKESDSDLVLFESGEEVTASSADPVFEYLASSDFTYQEKLALLRRHYRSRVFASGARDLMLQRPVYESLRETSAAADDAIRAALTTAGKPEGFCIIALGRLGTLECDLLSDADLIFVREESLAKASAIRTAEQMMEILSAYTREGTVFPVDARLRPNGADGDLVITPASFENYCLKDAQPWEALAYTKLRFVAGSQVLANRAMESTGKLMQRFAGDSEFAAAVREMRRKLEESAEVGNIKTSSGGLYDIDYTSSYLLVRNGVGEIKGNLHARLDGLRERGLLCAADCSLLNEAAELLRTVEHVIRLVTARPRKTLPIAGPMREAIERLVSQMSRCDIREGLEPAISRTFERVRGVYCRVVV